MYLNQTTAFPTSSANNQIVFPVPPTAGSGKITVTTPYGQATSTQDFLAVPSGISAGSIASFSRVSLGVPTKFSVRATNQYAGALFDGIQGQWMTLQFASIPANATITYTVYDPNNNVILTSSLTATNPSVHLPQLNLNGTYLLLMQSSVVPATWAASVEQDPTLVVGAAPLSIATAAAGQEKRFVVNVPSGVNLGVGIGTLSLSSGGYAASLDLYSAAGTSLGATICYPGSAPCDVNFRSQPPGTYTLIMTPGSGNPTMSFSILTTADSVGSLPLNTPTSMNIARNGQEADYSFVAQQGQTLAFNVSNLITSHGTGCNGDDGAFFEIVAPDGSTYASNWLYSGSDTTYNLPYLAQGGTYQIYVDPECGETATAQLTLVKGSTGTLALNGSAVNFTTNYNLQLSYMQFTVPANAHVGLGLLPTQSGGTGLPYFVTIYDASNTYVAGPYYCQTPNGCIVGFWNLPAGTYTAQGQAYGGSATLGFSAQLSSDLPVSLPVGKATPVTVARYGQVADVTFTATKGQNVALQVGNPTTTPSGSGITVLVYAPGAVPGVDSPLVSTTTTTATTINLPSVATSGTYLAYTFGSSNGATFSTTMQLTETAGTARPAQHTPAATGRSSSADRSGHHRYGVIPVATSPRGGQ